MPTVAVLDRVAKALGVSMADLALEVARPEKTPHSSAADKPARICYAYPMTSAIGFGFGQRGATTSARVSMKRSPQHM